MYLQKLYLQDFRQFTQATWEWQAGVNVIVAPNGSGKTTLLEAMFLLATGQSFRAGKIGEMIRFGQELGRVYGLTDENLRLGVTLTTGWVGGRKTVPKLYTIDKAKKLQKNFVGQLLLACFRPEDLRLVEGSSGRRRDYLDGPLELTNPVYYQARQTYAAALVRRNKTLKAIKEEGLDRGTLAYWDQQLLETGEIIHTARAAYVAYLNEQVAFPRRYRVVYDHSIVNRERLAHYQAAEIASGHTLIGPHRDDLRVETVLSGQEVDVAVYGSRGQQRLAVLWLKLAELQYLRDQTGHQPLLLLDDIFSELDELARSLVLAQISEQTTIITSVDEKVVQLMGQVNLVKLTHENSQLVATD